MDTDHLYLMQLNLLKTFTEEHSEDNAVSILYLDSFGIYPCLKVNVDRFLVVIEYRPRNDEIRSRFFYKCYDRGGYLNTKCFMIKRDAVPSRFVLFARSRSDYQFMSVSISEWADVMIDTVNNIRANRNQFIKLCKSSMPYNEDGTHKYKSWKNFAKVEITRDGDDALVQGIKGGDSPVGGHVVGGNGSFMVYNKGKYGIQYIVERIAGEQPRKGEPRFVNCDEYLRSIRDKLGYRRNMPYAVLNTKLPERVEVITYDMDLDPRLRDFVPAQYDGSWLKLLQDCFKDL